MINPMDLSGKKYIVTGASSGIGRACAVKISQLGGSAYLVARNEEQLNTTLSSMEKGDHGIYLLDIREIDKIEPIILKIVEEHGKLDGFVHCAGIADLRPLQQTKYDFLHNMMLISYYSFIEMSRVFSKNKVNNGGAIVTMSSVSSNIGTKSKTAYCGTKAAIDGSIRAMAHELSAKNIRVNSVLPGTVKTNMTDDYLKTAGEEAYNKALEPQYMGILDTDDIANAVCYLLSDAAKHITGTGFVVDGGCLS